MPGTATVQGSPVLGTGFTANTSELHTVNPPDVTLAKGPDGFLAPTNHRVVAYGPSGGRLWLRTSKDFYQAPSEVIDQHAIWHRGWQKYVIVGVHSQSVVVAAGPTLNGPWQVVNLGEGNDFPTLGFNAEKIFVAHNGATHLSVMDSSLNVTRVALPGELQLGQVPWFTQHNYAAANALVWNVKVKDSNKNKLRLSSFNPVTLAFTHYDVNIITLANAGGVRSDNGSTVTNYATRDVQSAQVTTTDGRLLLAHATAFPVSGATVQQVQYYIIDVTSGTPTLVANGTLGEAGKDAFLPGLAFSPDGTLGITYCLSSPSSRLTIMAAGVRKGALSGPVAVKVSPDAWITNGRLGDYAHVIEDNGTFYLASHYAVSARTPNWAVWVQPFTIPVMTTVYRGTFTFEVEG